MDINETIKKLKELDGARTKGALFSGVTYATAAAIACPALIAEIERLEKEVKELSRQLTNDNSSDGVVVDWDDQKRIFGESSHPTDRS